MPETAKQEAPPRAKPSDIRAFFAADGAPPVSLQEIKALKGNPKDYDQIAEGIGNGTLTY